MASTIDIRKVSLQGADFYTPVSDQLAFTAIGRLKGIPEENRPLLNDRFAFCRLLRRLVRMLLDGKSPQKAELMDIYKVPARSYNLALETAKGLIKGTMEAQKAALEDTKLEIARKEEELKTAPIGERVGREHKLRRLRRKLKNLQKQEGRPRILFGKKFFYDQKEGWKKAFDAARHDRFGAMGSADERSGNSTFQMHAVLDGSGKREFELRYRQKVLGRFKLDPQHQGALEAILAVNQVPFQFLEQPAMFGKKKDQPVRRKVTTGRVPLTVWLIRHEKQWYVHVSWIRTAEEPDYTPVGSIGVDLNCDSIAWSRVGIVDGRPKVFEYGKEYFDPAWSKARKREWILAQVNRLAAQAKEHHCAVVLEYLDFEHCKRWLKQKLGAMLRVMPYRQIRRAFERKAKEMGVVLRYVKSNHTSSLAAILGDYPNLGRDEGAAVVIGLRGTEDGNRWLEKRSLEIIQSQSAVTLRINRKRRFGRKIVVVEGLVERQSEHKALEDSKTGVHRNQMIVGRAINDLSKALGVQWAMAHCLPLCWKRSRDALSWRAVLPDSKRGVKVSKVAQLCAT
jgi:IS605 OrfB family transposase